MCLLLLLAGATWTAPAAAPEAGQVFKLREVSVFATEDSRFLRGQAAEISDTAAPEAKAYPAFKSAKPLYGAITFGGEYGDRQSGIRYLFAVDESQGTGKGYDRLYFDLNRDLDLRNDAPLKPQARPPGLLHDSSIKQQVVFDLLSINFDHGPAGTRAVELLPRLTISVYEGNPREYKMVTFVRTRLREGEISMAGQKFGVKLGNDYAIFGRLDAPGTALVLTPTGAGRPPVYWWGGDRLMGMHRIGGKYYRLTATPAGDELRVTPYTGELGTFQLGPGQRKLGGLNVQGSLRARDRAVAIGNLDEHGMLQAVESWSVPVGEYLPSYLNIGFGRLRISISENYHSEGKTRDRGERPLVYGVAIRKDKPFVWDFSNKPDVMFASPARDQQVKAGDELEVKAVLVDPKLDVMIRGLDDTTRNQTVGEGNQSYTRALSLDPTVVVKRKNGEKVAEGKMPFG